VLQHVPPAELTASNAWICSAEYVAMSAPDSVHLHIRSPGRGFKTFVMNAGRGFSYSAEVDGEDLPVSVLDYFITVQSVEGVMTYPNQIGIEPGAWDFPREAHGWRCSVLSETAPVMLFDTAKDFDGLVMPYRGYQPYPSISLVPGADGEGAATRLDGSKLEEAAENDVVCQFTNGRPIDLRGVPTKRFRYVVVRGRSAGEGPAKGCIILIERDGSAWGAVVKLPPAMTDISLALDQFKPVKAAMLPRDFPVGINPYWLRSPNLMPGGRAGMDLTKVQMIQLSVSSRFLASNDDAHPVVEIEHVSLRQMA
jgi:hypothetical protein